MSCATGSASELYSQWQSQWLTEINSLALFFSNDLIEIEHETGDGGKCGQFCCV